MWTLLWYIPHACWSLPWFMEGPMVILKLLLASNSQTVDLRSPLPFLKFKFCGLQTYWLKPSAIPTRTYSNFWCRLQNSEQKTLRNFSEFLAPEVLNYERIPIGQNSRGIQVLDQNWPLWVKCILSTHWNYYASIFHQAVAISWFW